MPSVIVKAKARKNIKMAQIIRVVRRRKPYDEDVWVEPVSRITKRVVYFGISIGAAEKNEDVKVCVQGIYET